MTRASTRRHVLLADVPLALQQPLIERLETSCRVSVMNQRALEPGAWESVPDVDVVVHGIDIAPSAGDEEMSLIDRATRGTWNILTGTRARASVLLSTMHLFEQYGSAWAIDEDWATAPTEEAAILAAHLAECVSREVSRSRGAAARVLRLDRIVTELELRGRRLGEEEIHIDDAVALVHASVVALEGEAAKGWSVVHGVTGHGRYPLGAAGREPIRFRPVHIDVEPATERFDEERSTHVPTANEVGRLPAPKSVTLFGAGGPLGAAAAQQFGLASSTRIVLTDIRPMAHFASAPPQDPTAPRPSPPSAPDSEQIVDVTNAAQVLRAAQGADCLVNCAVVRHEVGAAFRVNVLGAYNVMRAAVALGIKRVVHTGPAQILGAEPVGYAADRRVGSDAPARSGDEPYFLTKFLGQEICRVFAERFAIATPILLFTQLLTPESTSGKVHPFAVSWADGGRAIASAAAVERLGEPAPVVNVRAPSPHGRYREGDTAAVLGWEPQDRLDRLWMRSGAKNESRDQVDYSDKRG